MKPRVYTTGAYVIERLDCAEYYLILEDDLVFYRDGYFSTYQIRLENTKTTLEDHKMDTAYP